MAPAHPGLGPFYCEQVRPGGRTQASQRRFARRRISSGIGRIVPQHPEPSTRFILGAIVMSAMGWMWLRRLSRSGLTWESRPRTDSQRKRKTIPGVEPLEAMALLSTGSSLMSGAAVHLDHSSKDRLVSHVPKPPVSYTADMSSDQAPVTSAAQTVSIGNTLTNFTNLPLSPALNLFNPSLGTLLSVKVSR